MGRRGVSPSCEGSDCVDPSGTSLGSWWLDANHQPREGTPDGQPPECPDHAAQSSRDGETNEEGQQPVRLVAQAFGICERTVRKWRARCREAPGGRPGRSLVSAAPLAAGGAGGRGGVGRSPAARSVDGRPDRAGRGAQPRDGGADSSAPRPRAAARSSLPPSPSAATSGARPRGHAACGYEEARADRRDWASDHRGSAAPRARDRLGVRARGDR